MKVNQTKKNNWTAGLSRTAAVIIEKLVGAYAGANPKERRRLPLLSSLLLFMTVMTFAGFFLQRNLNLTSSYALLGTSGLLLLSYFISRTRFFTAAIRMAVLVSVIPLLADIIIQPQQINMASEFMWLALPLIVASLILTVRQTAMIALIYITLSIVLAAVVSVGYETTVLLVIFILSISIYVLAITRVRDQDQANLEIQLKERRETEEALRDSEERFRRIFQQGPIGIMVSGLDNKIKNVNDQFCKMLGYTEKELRSLTFKDFTFPEEIKSDQAQLEKLIKGKITIFNREKRVIRKDKEVIWENLTVTLMHDKNGKPLGFLAMVEDVTKRKQAEEELRTSEDRFHTIVDHSNDGIIFIQNGKLQYCNPKQLELLGYTEKEVMGQSFFNYVAPEDRKKAQEIYLKRISGQQAPDKYETNFLKKDGTVINTEISASLVKIGQEVVDMVIVRDITARKKAEEELAEEATWRRILIEQSRDGIVVLDQDGNVYEANQRFAEMLGYTIKEAYKLKVYDWEYQYPPERILEMINTVDEKGDHFETRHKRKDGTTYDVEISTNGAIIAGQKLIFCVCRDVTERKRMEQELRESHEKFFKAFQSVPQAVSITSIKDAKYVVVNDSFLALTGYTREEVIGRTAEELELWAGPEEAERVKQLLQQRDSFTNEEFLAQTKAKEKRTVLLTSDTINFGGEPCILVVRNDITERKQMEKSLKESEEKFAAAFHASPQEIVIVRNNDDVVLEVNESLTKATGYTREEVIGHSFSEFSIFADPEEYIKLAAMIEKEGRLVDQEFNFQNRSGSVRQVTCSAELITIQGEVCVIYVLTDITERKRMEESLRESEEKFSKAFKSSPQGILISGLEDGVIMEVNDAFVELTGISRKELIGKTANDFHLWNSPEEREEIIKILNEKGIVENIERHLVDRSGQLKTRLFSADKLTINNKPCMISVTVDITERKRMEEALKQSEGKFRELITTSTDAIISTDSNMLITVWNNGATRMFGYNEKEMVGQSFLTIFPTELYKDISREILNIRRIDTVEFANKVFETSGVKKDCSIIPIEISLSTRKSGNGNIVTAIIRDITKRKEAEEKLKAIDQMKQEFLSNVSHELRTPLQSISG
ncbi:MAG: PAS domain S-box protein, partial [Dehalococcoidales bacterium]|nr:PAS domain S-box protein [Dehalococcoidales bacterium]